jgi:hypothetical protein
MDYPAIHEYDESHRLIKLNIGQLLELPVENWKPNRPPDDIRVIEIEAFIQKKATKILQPLYIHYNPKIDVYEVLDGIHRYSAMKGIKDSHILDKIVFVHLFIDHDHGSLISIFNNLNKTVPVPELYLGPAGDNVHQKQIIEETVEQWKKMYKSHFSGSATSCQIPNIIRDNFINLLSELYKFHNVRNKEKLLELLERCNSNIKDYILSDKKVTRFPKDFSKNQLQKCSKTGCYLFLYKNIDDINYFIKNELTDIL